MFMVPLPQVDVGSMFRAIIYRYLLLFLLISIRPSLASRIDPGCHQLDEIDEIKRN
jgi:hypothetical protein